MKTRKQYTDDEKRALVAKFTATTLTNDEFARRNGISDSLLYKWRQQFGTKGAARSAKKIPPIVMRTFASTAEGETVLTILRAALKSEEPKIYITCAIGLLTTILL